MDFVTGLLISTDWKDDSYDSISVIFYWLKKMVNYEPVKITINTQRLAEVIFEVVVRHHDLPDPIISDRRAIFTFEFWSSLCYFFGIKRELFITFHY